MEYHQDFVNLIKNKYPNNGNLFVSFNPSDINISFQFFLANNYEKQFFAGVQHGSGYGIDARNENEIWERSISNILYIWLERI